jgi:hypothetical protein
MVLPLFLLVSLLSLCNAWEYTISLPFIKHETLYYSLDNDTQRSNGKGTGLVVGTAGINGAR